MSDKLNTHARPYSAAVPRSRRAEMTQFMLENPGCTKDDLKIAGGFSDDEITRHAGPASEAADRRAQRRVA